MQFKIISLKPSHGRKRTMILMNHETARDSFDSFQRESNQVNNMQTADYSLDRHVKANLYY